MPFRPQFAYPPPPDGWIDVEFVYYFDSTIQPSLGLVPSNLVPLQLEPDAEYRFRAIQITGNAGDIAVRFWTPRGEQISQVQVEADLAYGGAVSAGAPVGRLPVPLDDEIVCPAGSQLQVDLVALP